MCSVVNKGNFIIGKPTRQLLTNCNSRTKGIGRRSSPRETDCRGCNEYKLPFSSVESIPNRLGISQATRVARISEKLNR